MKTNIILLTLFVMGSNLLYSQDDKTNVKFDKLGSLKKIRNVKIIEINKKYLKALERLKIQLTKEGNLEAAIAVKEEIDKINNDIQKSSEVDSNDESKIISKDGNKFPVSKDYKMILSNYKLGTEHARPIKCRFRINPESKTKRGNIYLRFRTDKSPAHGTKNEIFVIDNDTGTTLHTINGSPIDKRHKIKLDNLKLSEVVDISIMVRGGDAMILKAHKRYDGHNIGIPDIQLTIE